MKNIYIYKFTVRFWNELDEETKTDKGIVAGTSYSDAVARVDSIYTHENGQTEISSLTIEDIDAYEKGVIFLSDIEEVFEEE